MRIRWIALTLLLAASVAATSPGVKSEGAALRWSVLGTGVPVGGGILLGGSGAGAYAFLGGAVFGPSMGHFYAACPGRAMVGIGIRSAAVVGLGIAVGDSWDDRSNDSVALGVGSVVVGAASILVDIATAPESARVHNSRLAEHRFSVVPWRTRDARGVRVSLEF